MSFDRLNIQSSGESAGVTEKPKFCLSHIMQVLEQAQISEKSVLFRRAVFKNLGYFTAEGKMSIWKDFIG